MKRQDYVFGSTTSNIEEQTPEALNNGWVELSILYSRVLNGVCAALSQSTNIVSQEVANAIVGMGVTLNPASDNQLLQVLQKLAIKATDFESPITASNKGATMKEIEEVVTSSFRFKGYVSTTQPTGNLVVDNLWINSSTMPSTFPVSASLIKKWNGSAWVNYGSAYTPMNFDAFRNNNDNEGYYWFGGQWKLLSTDLSTDYFRLNQTSGKWEIKSSVNLPGTPTCDTPSASNTRAIVNVDFVNNNTISSRNFTNCVTEIPQDIKLELNNGTLTLKAGSKVYVPNGAGNFDVRTIANDMSTTFSTNGTYLVGFAFSFGNITAYLSTVSGGTEPTTLTNGLTWYDTTNNVIKRAWAGSWQNSLFSFPFAIITVSGGAISSIDQVFNGFGYVGSTMFTLPGVKGLIPNGRNEDGTLKNTAINCTSVRTVTLTTAYSAAMVIYSNGTLGAWASIQYDPEKNINYNNSNPKVNVAIIGKCAFGEGGHVTLFEPNQPFHAVDYNDFESLYKTVEINDNNAVHKTGNETVAGTKTFAAQYLQVKNTAGTGGSGISIFDSNNKGSSNLEQYYTNGKYYTRLVSRNATAEKYAYVEIIAGDDGTMRFANANLDSMSAPTPANSSNSTDVATTAWVNTRLGGTSITSTEIGYLNGVTSAIQTQLNAKAALASPTFTGTPKAPTAASSTNNTQIATTAFVKSVLSSSGNGLATFSKAANGYYKFSNGLIIQWGRIAAEAASTTGSVTFPTAFTSANAAVQIESMAAGNSYFLRITSITSTGFSYGVDKPGSSSANPTTQKTWIAIGY